MAGFDLDPPVDRPGRATTVLAASAEAMWFLAYRVGRVSLGEVNGPESRVRLAPTPDAVFTRTATGWRRAERAPDVWLPACQPGAAERSDRFCVVPCPIHQRDDGEGRCIGRGDACAQGYDDRTGECRPTCGDGRVVGDEECDDGNAAANDGCVRCRIPTPAEVSFVDPAAPAGGDGRRSAPFASIAAALRVSARVIHLRTGLYAEPAESFPIALDGVAVIGDGPGTIIEGSGSDGRTVVLRGRPGTRLERLTVRPGSTSGDTRGIECVGGQAASGSLGPDPAELVDVTIGPGFESGVYVTAPDGTGAGCGLRMVGSRVVENTNGVFVIYGSNVAGRAGLAVERSDFVGNAWGIRSWDATSYLRVASSRFVGGGRGVEIINHGDHADDGLAHVEIVGSRFEGLSQTGVGLHHRARLDPLEGNIFAASAVGVTVAGESAPGPRLRARGNQFVGNGVGLRAMGYVDQLDLGRPAEPGRNRFRCNARLADPPGADVDLDGAEPGSALAGLAGNEWDHVPPSVSVAPGDWVDGVDVRIGLGLAAPPELASAASATVACPPGHPP